MNRRRFIAWTGRIALAPAVISAGCRGHQFGHLLKYEDSDLVGSHAAGAATFNPLIDEAVATLLARQEQQIVPIAEHEVGTQSAIAPKRVCFVCVENESIEEIGDFREQIYEQIDSQISASPAFQAISRRLVDVALLEVRIRPDQLFLPNNRRTFAAVLEREGEPIDYLLFAKITSGTTQRNSSTQRDYLLTLELVDIQTGAFDKQSAKIRKGYHKSRFGKLRRYNPFVQH